MNNNNNKKVHDVKVSIVKGETVDQLLNALKAGCYNNGYIDGYSDASKRFSGNYASGFLKGAIFAGVSAVSLCAIIGVTACVIKVSSNNKKDISKEEKVNGCESVQGE